jgi:hypothetical protein
MYVRVKDKGTRHEYSILETAYQADPEPYELLPNKEATAPDGTPLPPKHYKPLSNKSGQTADSEKENS